MKGCSGYLARSVVILTTLAVFYFFWQKTFNRHPYLFINGCGQDIELTVNGQRPITLGSGDVVEMSLTSRSTISVTAIGFYSKMLSLHDAEATHGKAIRKYPVVITKEGVSLNLSQTPSTELDADGLSPTSPP